MKFNAHDTIAGVLYAIMSTLKLSLLGSPQIELEGVNVTIPRRKALALLVYLTVTQERHTRETLATLFWPDHDERRARAYLRRAIAAINEALGKGWLLVDPEQVSFDPSATVWLDTDHFRRLLADCQTHRHLPDELCSNCLTKLSNAVDLYRDDFMTGFTLTDCPSFDRWQFYEREALRHECQKALEQLTHLYTKQSRYDKAITCAQRCLVLDPLQESVHRSLMKLYAWSGQQAIALRQYQECLRLLKEELDVPPEKQTTQLFETIRARRLLSSYEEIEGDHVAAHTVFPSSHDLGTPIARSAKPLSPDPAVLDKPHNLLPQPTSFIGRKQELDSIKRLLLNEPDCRLLTLVGSGGIGKTRLALQAAEGVIDAFIDGIYWVSLASVSNADFLVSAIAEALNFSFYGGTDPKAQLLDYLCKKKMLLVLDNFEQLLTGAELLSEIVATAPQMNLLVTSRERLHLREEWGFDVIGLPFPQGQESSIESDPEALEAFDAVQLFVQRARQTKVDFHLTQKESCAVVHICQLVDGMPLALELAATWMRMMSCQEIATEIEKNLDFLSTSLRNLPTRHRSLRAVFEQSWQLLSEMERTSFKKLSVFSRRFCARGSRTSDRRSFHDIDRVGGQVTAALSSGRAL